MFGRRLVSSFATERSIKWATYLNIGPMCKYESYMSQTKAGVDEI